jgi:hypothetical protein
MKAPRVYIDLSLHGICEHSGISYIFLFRLHMHLDTTVHKQFTVLGWLSELHSNVFCLEGKLLWRILRGRERVLAVSVVLRKFIFQISSA